MATLPLLSIPLRHFLEVARCGSVSQAAAQLFVAASAVSRQIGKLEQSLGTPLFERRARGMVLTPAGEHLAAHLANAQTDAEQVLDQVRHLGRQQSARIRLCCTEGFATGFLPAQVRSFQQQHPGCRIELQVAAPGNVSQRLLRGEADLGLKYVVAPETGLRAEHTAIAPVLAVLRPVHPLARQRVLALADVVRYPLLLGQRGFTARQMFDLACSAQGLRYEPVFASNMSTVLLALLGPQDVMLSGLLTVAHLIDDGSVVARPFADPLLQQRRLQVLSLEGRTLPALAQAFCAQLVGAMASAGRSRKGRARAAR